MRLVLPVLVSLAPPIAYAAPGGPPVPTTLRYYDTPLSIALERSADDDAPAAGRSIAVAPLHGTAVIVDQKTGRWRYTPNKGWTGNDLFEVAAPDGSRIKVVVSTTPPPLRRTWYVEAGKGNDANDGKSEATAFASIQAAQKVTGPGDTVLVKNGTYLQQSGQAVVQISRSGAPGAPITYRAFPGHKPVLAAKTAWNNILITASYIRVTGFEIAGNARAIPLAAAEAVYDRFLDPAKRTWGEETSATNINCISIRPAPIAGPGSEPIIPHHVEIIGNDVHDCPGAGIGTDSVDYVTIAFNRVYDNSTRTIFATSGISIWRSRDIDGETAAYKNVIRNNIVYGNHTEVKWYEHQRMSDGNGIIVDSTRNKAVPKQSYRGRTLIANNLSFDNGGSGIQVFRSDHVDIVFNTVYGNVLTAGLPWGQIVSRETDDIRVMDNIAVTTEGKLLVENDRTTRSKFERNLYYGGVVPPMAGTSNKVADPRFTAVDAAGARDFRLLAGSPAIDAAMPFEGITEDIVGYTRRSAQGPDIGAFEHPDRPSSKAEIQHRM